MCSLVVRFGLQRDALRYEVAAVGSGAERIKPRKVTGEIKLGCSSIRDSPGKEFCESRISRNPRSQVRIPLPGPRGAEEKSKSHSLSVERDMTIEMAMQLSRGNFTFRSR